MVYLGQEAEFHRCWSTYRFCPSLNCPGVEAEANDNPIYLKHNSIYDSWWVRGFKPHSEPSSSGNRSSSCVLTAGLLWNQTVSALTIQLSFTIYRMKHTFRVTEINNKNNSNKLPNEYVIEHVFSSWVILPGPAFWKSAMRTYRAGASEFPSCQPPYWELLCSRCEPESQN